MDSTKFLIDSLISTYYDRFKEEYDKDEIYISKEYEDKISSTPILFKNMSKILYSILTNNEELSLIKNIKIYTVKEKKMIFNLIIK
jgi:hypothetical protein